RDWQHHRGQCGDLAQVGAGAADAPRAGQLVGADVDGAVAAGGAVLRRVAVVVGLARLTLVGEVAVSLAIVVAGHRVSSGSCAPRTGPFRSSVGLGSTGRLAALSGASAASWQQVAVCPRGSVSI